MGRELNISTEVEAVAKVTVNALLCVHRELGPGLLESVYGDCLEEEFRNRGLPFVREIAIPLQYRTRRLDVGFRADFIVTGKLLLELKAIEGLLPVHRAQVISYLKLSKIQLGLLVNFNVPLIKDGIHRLFNPTVP